ncbi:MULTISPECIES: M23 family metallopeptidase [Nocardioides]|uniref:M23 family metallopeptidase n=1 Tax=Nocardioides vastitatis TaxID=2568655 RepID=A0ABW0ZBK6_9ACTN|nr:M23 family metallopeptidase [Nocardioides sp.]THI95639.1 M23 family metallopeptidase [Nocardioides sp.]
MGNHRADHRAPRRRSTPSAPSPEKYVGKRIAGRLSAEETTTAPLAQIAEPTRESPVTTPVVVAVEPAVRVEQPAELRRSGERAPTVELPALSDIQLIDPLSDSSTSLRAARPGKRRAVKHAGTRGPLFRGLPSMPVAVGLATLAVAVGGVVTSTADPQLTSASERLTATNAMTGSFGSGTVGTRGETISRDSDRDALAQANGADVVAEAERHAEERNSALSELARDADKEAAEIALNQWVLPIDPGTYRLTATYGQYGLWASYHTGLDFAAPSGTPIRAVANGVVTEVGSDGAYGNKTVITLEDGTEIWICHQSSYDVQEGDTVRGGDIIGYVGSTGHVTGPHLHLEVRPGGGDPVDPDAALRVHGVTP